MDFLDSLDLDISHKKSCRVRSWYLYEQFKSLEKKQLDAAQQLKNRSYQERILRQELAERKARRKLYDQFGLCQSESQIERNNKHDTKSSLSVSTEDFFESFCEVQEDEVVTQQDLSEDTLSQTESLTSKQYTDDFKSIDETKDFSYAESVNSVVKKIKSDENFVDKIEDEMGSCCIGESINLQLETVKENIECLENMTKQNDFMTSEDVAKEDVKQVGDKNINKYDNSLLAVWTRLVSFAYQCIQCNHGNCYYDYSTQFLTAVLACDVLRRSVGRMCNILQPYVSPIKYATDESDTSSSTYNRNVKRKRNIKTKKSWNTFEYKLHPNHKVKYTKTHHRGKYRSENCWQHCSKYSLENRINDQKNRRASEPLRSVPKSLTRAPSGNSASSNSIWPSFSKYNTSEYPSTETCKCTCHKRVLSPMLKLSQYLDSIMKDTDDSKHL